MSAKGKLLANIMLPSLLLGASGVMPYGMAHKRHSNRPTFTPSTEGHKEPTIRTKDKARRNLIKQRRNARRRRARR